MVKTNKIWKSELLKYWSLLKMNEKSSPMLRSWLPSIRNFPTPHTLSGCSPSLSASQELTEHGHLPWSWHLSVFKHGPEHFLGPSDTSLEPSGMALEARDCLSFGASTEWKSAEKGWNKRLYYDGGFPRPSHLWRGSERRRLPLCGRWCQHHRSGSAGYCDSQILCSQTRGREPAPTLPHKDESGP